MWLKAAVWHGLEMDISIAYRPSSTEVFMTEVSMMEVRRPLIWILKSRLASRK